MNVENLPGVAQLIGRNELTARALMMGEEEGEKNAMK